MSIIGKTYIPSDNSYSICLSATSTYSESNKVYFAGTANTRPIGGAVIVSEPYVQGIVYNRNVIFPNGKEGVVQKTDTHIFVNILYKGHTYRVLYSPSNVGRTDGEYKHDNLW